MSDLALLSGVAALGGVGCAAIRSGDRNDGIAQMELHAASALIHRREISPVELTRACLDRIERFAAPLNAFITVTADQALRHAAELERELTSGAWRGPLHGIPIALKDNIDTAGVKTTAACRVFTDRVPAETAELAERLHGAGAIVLGKLNMHEAAMGSTSAISPFGPVRNPWDLARVAGGSSGGAAAAVSMRLCFGAVGTDTGGSIRIPAACCGVTGFKPTYGVVSTRGIVPLSLSYDHAGPICRSARDAEIMFRGMTAQPPAHEALDANRLRSLRVGVLHAAEPLCDFSATEDVQAAFAAALDIIAPMVAEIKPAQFEPPDLGALIFAEFFEYHAAHVSATPEAYDPRTLAILIEGRAVPRDEVLRLRRQLQTYRASLGARLGEFDILVTPTMPDVAMRIADATAPLSQSACTFAFNTAGAPSISVPCGFAASGLPIGLQISGAPFRDGTVLALAQAFQDATNWHERQPAFKH